MNSNPEITIQTAPGLLQSDTDGADLVKCYFQARENGHQWRLHQPDGEKIKTEPHHLVSGTDFTFTYDNLCWSITNFLLWEGDAGIWFAKGSWAAHSCTTPADPGAGEDDPESGTFQAQSGGGGDPERKATATA